MNVLLARPPQIFKIGLAPKGPRFCIPIGLLSIATYLDLNHYNVKIFDFLAEKEDNELFKYNNILHDKLGEELYCGTSYNNFKKELETFHPQIIGISNPFFENLNESIQLASYIKSIDSNIKIVFGGACSTIHRHSLISNNNCIDYVISGDGEKPLLNLCQLLEKKINPINIDGITFIDENGNFIDNPAVFGKESLDFCNYYNYSLIKLENYLHLNSNLILSRNTNLLNDVKSSTIITSRGCPYQCSFCSVSQISGNLFRFYSVQFIINQIKYLKKNYRICHFHFEDDNISFNIERFENFLDLIIADNLQITWDTPNGIHHKNLNKGILEKMKLSGCQYIILGIESRNEKILKDEINKKIDFDIIQEIIKQSKKLKLPIHAFYIIGFPNEKKQQILQTTFYAIKQFLLNDLIPHLSILRPDEGTKIFENAKKLNVLKKDHVFKNPFGYRATTYTRNIISSKHFTPKYLESVYFLFSFFIVFISFFRALFFITTKRNCLNETIGLYRKVKYVTNLNAIEIFPFMQWNYFYYLK